MKRFFYFIPGILSAAEATTQWSNQAQAWVIDRGLAAEGETAAYNYAAGVLGALLTDDQHADVIAADLREAIRLGYEVVVEAHSNGCLILVRMFQRHPDLRCVKVVFLAAAANADCAANGLNQAAENGQLGTLVLGVSPADEVLSLPAISYGRLGLDGPMNVSQALMAVLLVVTRQCRHSDWVGVYLDESLHLVES